MTLNETFHFVAEKLLKQGVKSQGVSPGGAFMCLYRDSNGNKCAAGHLILDEEYNPMMEGCVIERILRLYPEIKNINEENIDLVKHLQKLHDGMYPYLNVRIGDWPKHLYDIAYKFGITPKLQQWL